MPWSAASRWVWGEWRAGWPGEAAGWWEAGEGPARDGEAGQPLVPGDVIDRLDPGNGEPASTIPGNGNLYTSLIPGGMFGSLVWVLLRWLPCPTSVCSVAVFTWVSPLKWFQSSSIHNGPLLSFKGRLSSASSFHASLLQALYPQVVSQAPQHFRSSKKQATCEGCFACQSICSSFPFTLACLGQYTHRSFQW